MSQCTQLPWRRRGPLDLLFTARAGLGSSWVARRNNLFFEPEPMCAVTDGGCHITSFMVPPLTLLGLEPMLQYAALMESLCEGLGTTLGRSGYFCDA